MATKVSTAIADGTAAEAAKALARDLVLGLSGAEPVLVTVFASTKQPLHEVTQALAREMPGATIVGASTAGEFTEREDRKGSVAALCLAGDYRAFAGLGTGLKAAPERAINAALDGLPGAIEGYPHRTAIMLLDPLAGNGEEATLVLASILGDGVPLAGGAAGDDLAMKATHVAAGGRAASDAVVLAMLFSKQPLGLGVCHGHEPLSKPLTITRSSGNVVYEVNHRPAWDVWIESTAERAAARGAPIDDLPKDKEGAYLLLYEAGLASGDQDYKIRAPLSRNEDGSIAFACGIPEGAIIRIMESEPVWQIQSAREAARRARESLGSKPAGALVFDCICRNLVLGGEFVRAVHGISEELGGVKLAGFETYGEIALDAGDLSGFHNTTSVVLAFPE